MSIQEGPREFEYEGYAYRQATSPSAPWLMAFVATAEEVCEWAGIPRRQDVEAGFQRAPSEDRIENAKQFFELEAGLSQSPTSLLVGIHPSIEGQVESVKFDFLQDVPDGSNGPIPCRLTVRVIPDEDIGAVAKSLCAQLESRLSPSGTDSDEADGNSDAEEAVEGAKEGDDEDEVVALEMGESQLIGLIENLQDPSWIQENEELVRDLAKPATIIDGQHRALGARACERGIPFAICAIVGCSWAEQVFQFTIINYTQKGIPDQFITANAALSLTREELDHLKERLDHSKVKVLEYELMEVVHFNPGSPFFELVNLSEKPSKDLIGYKTMVGVAKAWYNAKDKGLAPMLDAIYSDVEGRGKVTRRRELWREGAWGKVFIAFWRVVKRRFAGHASHVDGHGLWDVGYSQLIVAVVLMKLQERFFVDLRFRDTEWFEVEGDSSDVRLANLIRKVELRAETFVKMFPPEFFAHKWATSSLNTSAGKDALDNCLKELQESSGSYQWQRHPLVKGQGSAS